jgi:hypothetical protein
VPLAESHAPFSPTLIRTSSFPAEFVLQVNGHSRASPISAQLMTHDGGRFAMSRVSVLEAQLVV